MAFAQHQFLLAAPQNDGLPLRDHLESVSRQTGRVPALLADAPELPRGCEQLWRDFLQLHESRGSSGFGSMRITYADIDAWQRVNEVRLSAWEIDAIRQTDNLWLREFAPKPKADK